MKTLIENARLIDPASGLDTLGSLAIADGVIAGLGDTIPLSFEPDTRIDAQSAILCPGLVDAGVHMPSAGMLERELQAAVSGGITHIVCSPDSKPILDEPGLVEMLGLRAAQLQLSKLYPLGALTTGLRGETLSEMVALSQAGCIGMGQASQPITNTQVLERAMNYAANHDLTVWLHPLDPWLGGGVAATGAIASNMGLTTVPESAETIALFTIFALMRSTQAKVHLCRISSAAGVQLLKEAKAQGLTVSADISIQQLHLCEDDTVQYDSRLRLTPPLRSKKDKAALRQALADGVIDVLVSDHCPVSAEDKILPFAQSAPGASALELLLPLCIAWAEEDGIDYAKALSRITSQPALLLDKPANPTLSALAVGAPADLCLFQTGEAAHWHAHAGALRSSGQFTPFDAQLYAKPLVAQVLRTWVSGREVYTRDAS